MVENPDLGSLDSPFSGLNRMDEPVEEALPSQETDIHVLVSPIRRPDNYTNGNSVDFEPFNPRTVSKDLFDQKPGNIQEFALKYLIRVSDNESISRVRPDFMMDEPLSDYEIKITDAIDEITRRDDPIEPNSKDGLFNFIHSFTSSSPPKEVIGDEEGYRNFRLEEEAELAKKLEAERQRRLGNNDLFYSWDWIGSYPPSRRYRRLLELQVQKEIEEEKLAAQKLQDIEAKKRAYEDAVSAITPNKVAEIRPELTSMEGGLSSDAA